MIQELTRQKTTDCPIWNCDGIEIYRKVDADRCMDYQKYRRCLALYRGCKDNADWWNYEQINRLNEQHGNDESLRFKEAHAKFCHYVKWEQRWLELSKHYKEK